LFRELSHCFGGRDNFSFTFYWWAIEAHVDGRLPGVRESKFRLQSRARRLLEVQEKNRRHLGRELHDEFGQLLTTITLHLDATLGFGVVASLRRLDECAIHLTEP
jgi:signal transduction histidine kinase